MEGLGYTRRERRDREGIMLTYVAGAIGANEFDIIELTGKYEKYKPFDSLTIFNNSSSLLRVYINQSSDNYHNVAGKTEKTITNIRLHNLKISELSGTAVNAGDVVLNVERTGITADSMAKKIARRFGW